MKHWLMDPKIYDDVSTRQILKMLDKDLTRYFLYQNIYESILNDFKIGKINNNYLMMKNALDRIRFSPFYEKSIEYHIGYFAIEQKLNEHKNNSLKCEHLYKLCKDVYKIFPECKNLNNDINISDIIDKLEYKLMFYKT